MRPHRIWTSNCKGCNAWVRVIDHPVTNEPIVQELHEGSCHVFPRQQRRDAR